jgi:hypothetical protein
VEVEERETGIEKCRGKMEEDREHNAGMLRLRMMTQEKTKGKEGKKSNRKIE